MSFIKDLKSPEMVSPLGAIVLFFKNIGNYKGRSTRSEYWFAMLFYVLLSSSVLWLIRLTSAFAPLVFAYFVLTAPSLITLQIRRLHDTDRSGLYLLGLIMPFYGQVMYVYWMTRPSVDDNLWGRSALSLRGDIEDEEEEGFSTIDFYQNPGEEFVNYYQEQYDNTKPKD